MRPDQDIVKIAGKEQIDIGQHHDIGVTAVGEAIEPRAIVVPLREVGFVDPSELH